MEVETYTRVRGSDLKRWSLQIYDKIMWLLVIIVKQGSQAFSKGAI